MFEPSLRLTELCNSYHDVAIEPPEIARLNPTINRVILANVRPISLWGNHWPCIKQISKIVGRQTQAK